MVEPVEEDVIQPRHRKSKGKREADLKDFPVEVITHTLSEEKLQDVFDPDGWKQLPNEIYKRVRMQPAVYTVEEHHLAVYAGKDNQTIIRVDVSPQLRVPQQSKTLHYCRAELILIYVCTMKN